MRILLVNTDYPDFTRWLYARHAGLESRSYDEQLRVRYESLFGVADFWSRALRELGHEAHDLYVNVAPLQGRWAAEHGIRPARGPVHPSAPSWQVN